MTTTPTPEAIEAAADAIHKVEISSPFRAGPSLDALATAALTAAAPFIAAQAKAEALREAADAFEQGIPQHETAHGFLRARAATIEGESS